MTGGSDCHGFSKGKPLIGTVKLPYEHVERLKSRSRAESRGRKFRAPQLSPPLAPLRTTLALTHGTFPKFRAGLQKTHSKLAHEIKRIVTRSPKLDAASLEELEAALIAADLGLTVTAQIIAAVKHTYETQGGAGLDVLPSRGRKWRKVFAQTRPRL